MGDEAAIVSPVIASLGPCNFFRPSKQELPFSEAVV